MSRPQITNHPTNTTVLEGQPIDITIDATGTPPLNYQWYFGTTALISQTNSELYIGSAREEDQGSYRVVVGNSAGSTASRDAFVTVIGRPHVTQSLSNVLAYLGSPVTFSANVVGRGPLSMQWQFNGADVPSATNSDYRISTAGFADAGNYWLTASNEAGTTTSALCRLSVNAIDIAGNLTLAGPTGTVYQLERSLDLSDTNWSTLTNLTLPASPFIFVDPASAGLDRRFYRTTVLP